jgi:hypothetical protein
MTLVMVGMSVAARLMVSSVVKPAATVVASRPGRP